MNRFSSMLLGPLLMSMPAAQAAPAPPPRTTDPEKHFFSCLRDGGKFDHPEFAIRVEGVRERTLFGVVIKRKNREGG
jgi:hypothetical protein